MFFKFYRSMTGEESQGTIENESVVQLFPISASPRPRVPVSPPPPNPSRRVSMLSWR